MKDIIVNKTRLEKYEILFDVSETGIDEKLLNGCLRKQLNLLGTF